MEVRKYPLKTLQLSRSWIDFPDNESLAVCVCAAGCSHKCRGCHNPDLQNYHWENLIVWESVDALYFDITDQCRRNKTNKIVFSGGDPLYEKNRAAVKSLLENLYKDYEVCVYTGFEIKEVRKMNLKFKYIKCGKFDEQNKRKSYKTDDEFCLASPNQNFYNAEYKIISKNGILYFNDGFSKGEK
jgi:anaerobic ribonucleoside-triphosphate reductase activating protein